MARLTSLCTVGNCKSVPDGFGVEDLDTNLL